MVLFSIIFASINSMANPAMDIVMAHPTRNSITFDQTLIELLGKPYNEEKVMLLKKYELQGAQEKTGEQYSNIRNKYNSIVVERDPQGNLRNIIHNFPTKDGLQSENLSIPNKAVTYCGFNLQGRATGCLTQSQYVCDIMNLRNRDQYMLDQVSTAHRQGVLAIQKSLPGFYRRKLGKHRYAFSKIKNSLDPKNKGALMQVCDTNIAYINQIFTAQPMSTPAAAANPVVDGTK